MNLISLQKRSYLEIISRDFSSTDHIAELHFADSTTQIWLHRNEVDELAKLIATIKPHKVKIGETKYSITHEFHQKITHVIIETDYGILELDAETLLMQLCPEHIFAYLKNLEKENSSWR